MRNNKLFVVLFSILLASSVYAQINPDEPALTLTAHLELSRTNPFGKLILTNVGQNELRNIQISYDQSTLIDSGGRMIILNIDPTNIPVLKTGESIGIAVESVIPSNFDLGEYSTILTVKVDNREATSEIKIINSFCRFGRIGNDIEIQSVKDVSSAIEWEWKPLDKVTLEVTVRNNANEQRNVEMIWVLYDPIEHEFLDLGWDEKVIPLAGNSISVEIINIAVPFEIEDRIYSLYIKAFQENDEDMQCADLVNGNEFQQIRLKKPNREVILRDINLPLTVNPGSTFDISVTAFNIGRYDEDRVKIRLYNEELRIDQESTPFALDEQDMQKIYFTTTIPNDLKKESYVLEFFVFYDYDEDTRTYDKSGRFTAPLAVRLTQFMRGDSNIDGKVDISDAIFILNWLFLGGTEPQCKDATDIDDSGRIDITDVIYVLDFLFRAGNSIPEPYPLLGHDSTEDTLTCDSYNPPQEMGGGGGSVETIKDALNETKNSNISDETKSFLINYLESIPKGTLSVSSYPSYAYIYVDNVYKGITPKSITNLTAGNYTLTLFKPGYITYSKTVNIQAGKVTTVSALLATTSPTPSPSPSYYN